MNPDLEFTWVVTSSTAPACDPYHHARVGGKGLITKTSTWDIALPVQLTTNLAVGVIGAVGRSSADWRLVDFNANSDSTTYGFFAIYTFAPNFRLLGAVTSSQIDSKFVGLGSSGSFDSRIITYQGSIERRFNVGSWTVTPSAGVMHARATRDAFRDVVFSEFQPETRFQVTRIHAGATVAHAIPVGNGRCIVGPQHCGYPTAFANVTVFHDQISGQGPSPTPPPVPLFDDNYFGVSGGVGVEVPVTRNVSVGARTDWFSAGDMNGWALKAFVNFDAFGLLGMPRPRPLFER